ncbi:MAG: YHS domain-containing protein [Sedimentisphaerales bacterium]
MNGKKKQIKIIVLLSSLLLIGLVVVGGCKKSEPEGPTGTVPEVKDVTPVALEQTTCPIMNMAIDKNIFVEYKGKKVYFCCAGCKEKFEAEPEKYLAKLPQFKK